MLNNLNRGMGMQDAYPFVLPTPAIEKLRFIHEVIGNASSAAASPKPPSPPRDGSVPHPSGERVRAEDILATNETRIEHGYKAINDSGTDPS